MKTVTLLCSVTLKTSLQQHLPAPIGVIDTCNTCNVFLDLTKNSIRVNDFHTKFFASNDFSLTHFFLIFTPCFSAIFINYSNRDHDKKWVSLHGISSAYSFNFLLIKHPAATERLGHKLR